MDELQLITQFPLYWTLYKGTEALLTSVVDQGVGESIKRLVGQQKARQRQQAFAAAVQRADAHTRPQHTDASLVLDALNSGNAKLDEAFGRETAKLLLFKREPSALALARPVERYLRFENVVTQSDATLPDRETIATVLSDLLANLRDELVNESPYREILLDNETLHTLEKIYETLQPHEHASEQEYREQMVALHSRLRFVGLPMEKEHQPITVDNLFVRLRIEQRVETLEPEYLVDGEENFVGDGRGNRLVTRMPERVTTTRRLDIDEALRATHKLVILGDPGTGKTTLLQFLTVICAEGRAGAELNFTAPDGGSPLPIFVSLREYAAELNKRDGDYSLLDFLHSQAHERLHLRLPPTFFTDALTNGRCLVCLDGLDEVWTAGQRRDVTDAVHTLASRFGRNRFLVTSRVAGYQEAALDRRDWQHGTVLPLTDDDIRLFVQKWYAARETDPALRERATDDLIAILEHEAHIRDLARNPLLLTIIALVHRVEADLPHERAQLYEKCVRALIETWDSAKNLSLADKQRPFYKMRRRLLERLAFWLHEHSDEPGKLQVIRWGDLKLRLAHFMQAMPRLGLADDWDAASEEADALIRLVRGRTGLLIESGDRLFTFPHLTFQEYLAACDIKNRSIAGGTDQIWQEIWPRLHDAHWREPILLLIGQLGDYDGVPDDVVQRIWDLRTRDKFEAVLHRNLILCANIVADRIGLDPTLECKIIDRLLQIAQEHSYEERERYFSIFARLVGNHYAALKLLEVVSDEDNAALNRWRAAQVLGAIVTDEDNIEKLLLYVNTVMAKGRAIDYFVYAGIADALSALGKRNTDVESTLLSWTTKLGLDIDTRRYGALLLGQFNGPKAQEILYDMLPVSPSRACDEGHVETIAAIGQLGEFEKASRVLLKCMDTSNGGYGITLPAAALQKLGKFPEIVPPLIKVVMQTRTSANYSTGIVQEAIKVLGESGFADPDTMDCLLNVARNEDVRDWLRAGAIEALAALDISEPRLLDAVLDIAKNVLLEWDLRAPAVKILGRVRPVNGEAVKVLRAIALHEDYDKYGDSTNWRVKYARDDPHYGVPIIEEALIALGNLEEAEDVVKDELLRLAYAPDGIASISVYEHDTDTMYRIRAHALGALSKLTPTEQIAEDLLRIFFEENSRASWTRRYLYTALETVVAKLSLNNSNY